jgi:NAD(P)-dependent dehydrogenase (short-subunit alcohol dehydrogenase family)
VTGAGSNPGLGRSYARLLAERGARVVVNDVRGAEEVAAEIRAAGGEAVADTSSVAEQASAAAVVTTAIETWGRIDALVNNAGVYIHARLDEIVPFDIERVIAVHLMGTIWTTKAAWPHMRDRGYGRIVNTTSSAALGLPLRSIYGAAKGGILSFSRSLAIEGEADGIKVNALGPGAGTAGTLSQAAEDDDWSRTTWMLSTPDMVAPVVAYLAHESCAFSGKWLGAGSGAVFEHFVSRTDGFRAEALTAEDVVARMASILDRSASSEVADPIEGTRGKPMPGKPYEPGGPRA